MKGVNIAELRTARIALALTLGIREHCPDLLFQVVAAIAQEDRIVIRLAHLPPVDSQQFRNLREKRLGDRKDVGVEEIETACDLPRQLDMGKLIDAHRNAIGLVHDDVRRLENRVAEETERREIFLDEFLSHLLIGRIPFEPCEGGDHGEKQEEFGMFLDRGLDEEGALCRLQAGRKPVDDHVDGVRPDSTRCGIVARQRMPIRHEVEALIIGLVLKGDPV